MSKEKLRKSALFMADHLEMNAKGFRKLGMNSEADACIEKARKIREKNS